MGIKLMHFITVFGATLLIQLISACPCGAAPAPFAKGVSIGKICGILGKMSYRQVYLEDSDAASAKALEKSEANKGIEILKTTEKDPMFHAIEFSNQSVQFRLNF